MISAFSQLLATILFYPICWAYFADWGAIGGRPHEPSCVDIPSNMSLCSDIGYDKMRLPNLLEHDTLMEVRQQSVSWVPLLNVRCHPNTKLFLCSLFTPVCLESPIFPCRSLCLAVQKGCEQKMREYGYHWPDMLRCDKFPQDNDMCIKDIVEEKPEAPFKKNENCRECSPSDTYENMIENYCNSDFVIRARVGHPKGTRVSIRKIRVFKASPDISDELPGRTRALLDSCCSSEKARKRALIMGNLNKRRQLVIKFILPWTKTKAMKRAMKAIGKMDCTKQRNFRVEEKRVGDRGEITAWGDVRVGMRGGVERQGRGKKRKEKKRNGEKRKNRNKKIKELKNRRRQRKEKMRKNEEIGPMMILEE